MENSKQYILKKMFIDGDRNVYYPRTEPYLEHELPARCRDNEEYCTVVGGDKAIIVSEVSQVSEPVKEVKLVEYSKTKETKMTPKIEKIEVIEKVNINESSINDILNIKGIGEKLASKIVEERKNGLFNSIDDLNERVPVSFGGNWEKYKELIRF